MSRVTKRKHVMKEMLTDDFEHPSDHQQIAKVLSSKGNNLHAVEPSDDNEPFLVSMPTKFRNNIWIKRGDFIIIEPIHEGVKVKAEIVRILTLQHIKEFTKDGIWPSKFSRYQGKEVAAAVTTPSESDDDELIVDESGESDTDYVSDED